jgi:hypothetical protein
MGLEHRNGGDAPFRSVPAIGAAGAIELRGLTGDPGSYRARGARGTTDWLHLSLR